MKNMKKILILSLAALLLVAVSVGGTIAFLTDTTDAVTNVFTTSHVDITLEETEQTYKMIPGAVLSKDPKVTVLADSEACWVFVKIDEEGNVANYIEYAVASPWKAVPGYTGVYYIEQAATDKDVPYPVLANDRVTVKDGLDNADMTAAETNKPKLIFTAYAVQKEAADSAAEAWGKAEQLKYPDNAYPVPATGN